MEERKIREARAQLIFKEKSEKVYQLATDLGAITYSFLWVTWSAELGALDQNTLKQYWDEVGRLMPRLYGDYVQIAGLMMSLVDWQDLLWTKPIHLIRALAKWLKFEQRKCAATEELACRCGGLRGIGCDGFSRRYEEKSAANLIQQGVCRSPDDVCSPKRVARSERSEIRGKRPVRLECRSRVSLRSTQATTPVIPALVAGIHVFMVRVKPKTWMAGTSPAMTVGGVRRHVHLSRSAILSRSRTAPDIVIGQGKT